MSPFHILRLLWYAYFPNSRWLSAGADQLKQFITSWLGPDNKENT